MNRAGKTFFAAVGGQSAATRSQVRIVIGAVKKVCYATRFRNSSKKSSHTLYILIEAGAKLRKKEGMPLSCLHKAGMFPVHFPTPPAVFQKRYAPAVGHPTAPAHTLVPGFGPTARAAASFVARSS